MKYVFSLKQLYGYFVCNMMDDMMAILTPVWVLIMWLVPTNKPSVSLNSVTCVDSHVIVNMSNDIC